MAGRKPDYKVLVSRQNEDKSKTYYNDVGVGWDVAKDGISLQLYSLPVDGKLVIFPRKEEDN